MSGSRRKSQIGPSADPVTLDNLPPPDTTRWVARRKAQVVAAVQAGLLTLDEALLVYKLTLEEYSEWQRALLRHGLRGLEVTHSQICRLARRRRGRAGVGKRALGWSGQHG